MYIFPATVNSYIYDMNPWLHLLQTFGTMNRCYRLHIGDSDIILCDIHRDVERDLETRFNKQLDVQCPRWDCFCSRTGFLLHVNCVINSTIYPKDVLRSLATSQITIESFLDAQVRETFILFGSVLTMTDQLTALRIGTLLHFKSLYKKQLGYIVSLITVMMIAHM